MTIWELLVLSDSANNTSVLQTIILQHKQRHHLVRTLPGSHAAVAMAWPMLGCAADPTVYRGAFQKGCSRLWTLVQAGDHPFLEGFLTNHGYAR